MKWSLVLASYIDVDARRRASWDRIGAEVSRPVLDEQARVTWSHRFPSWPDPSHDRRLRHAVRRIVPVQRMSGAVPGFDTQRGQPECVTHLELDAHRCRDERVADGR